MHLVSSSQFVTQLKKVGKKNKHDARKNKTVREKCRRKKQNMRFSRARCFFHHSIDTFIIGSVFYNPLVCIIIGVELKFG